MKPEKILHAMNEIDDAYLQEARSEAAPVHRRSRRLAVLVAAMVALMAVTATAFAAENIAGWFKAYFEQQNNQALTTKQHQYIVENEQLIAEAQNHNGWSVELRSAITDGEKAYIIIGITAPENVNLEQRIVDNSVMDWFGPGNAATDLGSIIAPSIQEASIKENYYYQISLSYVEDGDGLPNTKNIVIGLNLMKWYPAEPCGLEEPFGPDIDFTIHIENIVHEYEDEEYRRELMDGKYAGQTDVMFTHEETLRLRQIETLAEGTWDFTVNFGNQAEGIELLSTPMEVQADIWRNFGDGIEDYSFFRENITVTSVILRPLTVTLFYEDCNGGPTFSRFGTESYAVMKDRSTIVLHDHGASGRGGKVLEAASPIVLEEVDHILLADGTKIAVP